MRSNVLSANAVDQVPGASPVAWPATPVRGPHKSTVLRPGTRATAEHPGGRLEVQCPLIPAAGKVPVERLPLAPPTKASDALFDRSSATSGCGRETAAAVLAYGAFGVFRRMVRCYGDRQRSPYNTLDVIYATSRSFG
jgi:hypothetical protein